MSFESHKKDESRMVEPVAYLVEVVDLVHFEALWEHSSGNPDVGQTEDAVGDAVVALGLEAHELPDRD